MEALDVEPTITSAEHARVWAHYERAMPWLVRQFGGTPVVGVSFPNGFAADAVYHKTFAALPKTIGTVAVRTSTGIHPYVRFDAHDVTWLCAAHFVVELHGWSPRPNDPDRAAFARLVLSPQGAASEGDAVTAAAFVRERLAAQGLQGIPILDGVRGLSLWIPFDDGPDYVRLGGWLHAFAAAAAVERPESLTVAPLRAERGDRVYLGTKSNHPGMGSLLPYALRGTPALEVSVPIGWDELRDARNGDVTEGNFREYMRTNGDAFERLRASIGRQSFGDRAARPAPREALLAAPEATPRNYIISAALVVLADGKTHTADAILQAGLARGLLPKSTTRKYVYTALHEYVVRTLGANKTPELVQTEDGFRLNEPADPWPAVALPPPPRWLDAASVAALVARLRATATGEDPAAFEIAACDAFGALGFAATHVGGNAAPDGILGAPLGVAGYRAILECKTASPGGIVSNPRAEEAAKFRDANDATQSILLGPAFGNDTSLDDELKTHGVALWTVDDLALVLEQQIGPDEIRPALAAGRAQATLRSIVWERSHGRRKRIAVIADRLARAGWQTQVTLARGVAPGQMPALTEDTLLVLVDEALVGDGITDGVRIDEAHDAITALEVAGILRREGDGFVFRQPVAPQSNDVTPPA